jgi:hypothetical protein
LQLSSRGGGTGPRSRTPQQSAQRAKYFIAPCTFLRSRSLVKQNHWCLRKRQPQKLQRTWSWRGSVDVLQAVERERGSIEGANAKDSPRAVQTAFPRALHRRSAAPRAVAAMCRATNPPRRNRANPAPDAPRALPRAGEGGQKGSAAVRLELKRHGLNLVRAA